MRIAVIAIKIIQKLNRISGKILIHIFSFGLLGLKTTMIIGLDISFWF